MTKKAIIHVDDTDNLLDFARYLVSSGWTLLSADKTEEFLKKEKIPVVREPALVENNQYISETSQLINAIHKTRYSESEYSIEDEQGGVYIVCINLTPKYFDFSSLQVFQEVFKAEKSFLSGLVRNSVTNYQNILIITDPADYKEAMIQLRIGSIKPEFRAYLAAKALNMISAYDAAIANSVLRSSIFDNKFPEYFTVPYKKISDLHSGENSHQQAALYSKIKNEEENSYFTKLQGKDYTYNSCCDLSFGWEQICFLFSIMKNQMTVKSINCDGYEFTTQFTPVVGTVFTVAVKNKSILGAALSPNVLESFKQTYTYDIENIKNVTLACSSVINEEAAREMVMGGFESIIAPGFTNEAKQVFSSNRNIRLVSSAKTTMSSMESREILGGLLSETKENILFEKWNVRTKNRPSQYKTDEMAFGMMLIMNFRSYSAVLIKQNSIIGIAQSCVSGVKAVREVLFSAQESIGRHPATGSEEIDRILGDILVTDFPIPFCDETKEIIENGVTAIIQPGGTPDDEEFIEYCDERGIVMIFTGMSHLLY